MIENQQNMEQTQGPEQQNMEVQQVVSSQLMMNSLQHQSNQNTLQDWNQAIVQQQQQQQQQPYVQQLYNTNGQMLMSGNLLHPNMNNIQVITKPYQQILNKPLNQQWYNNQALVIGQLGVNFTQKDVQKGQKNNVLSAVVSQPMLHQLISPIQYTTCQNRMGSTPWQFSNQIPQVWPQQQVIAQNPIYIRNPQDVYVQQNRLSTILPSTPSVRPTSQISQILPKQPLNKNVKKIIKPSKDAQNQTKNEYQEEIDETMKEIPSVHVQPLCLDSDEIKPSPPKAMVKPQVLTHVIEGYVIQESSEPFPLEETENENEPPCKKQNTGETKSDSESETEEPQNTPIQFESVVNPVKWTVSDVCDFMKKLPGCEEYVEDFASQEIDGQALLLLKEDHLMSAMSMKLGPALKICANIERIRAAYEMSLNKDK